ncbi:MAG: hypothetical protein H6834_12585 [Planctomycetes bacterium]|nr:hypothetical protein [Planctomycetota bacterium]
MKAVLTVFTLIVFLASQGLAQSDLKERLEKSTDPIELLDIAAQATKKRQRKLAEEAYEKVLKYDPQNPEAHKGLGHVQAENGEWMTKKDYRKWLREMKKAGKDPAEMKKEEGDGKANITPVPDIDIDGAVEKYSKADEKEASEIYDDLGIEISAMSSENFFICAQWEEQQLRENLKFCEGIIASLREQFAVPEKEKLFSGRCRYYIYPDKQNFIDGFPHLQRKLGQAFPGLMNPSTKNLMVATGRFTLAHSRDPKFSSLSGGFIDIPPKGYFAHVVGKTFVEYLGGPLALPDGTLEWLEEGFAIWTSLRFFGDNLLTSITASEYANTGRADKNKDNAYKLLCLEMIRGGSDKPMKTFYQLSHTKLNDLDFRDLARCWSLVHWLTSAHQEKFIAFIRDLRKIEKAESDRDDTEAFRRLMERKVKKVFGWSLEQLDEEWKQWVLANYSV